MAIILAKKNVGRFETLQYANKKFDWGNVVIGVSAWFGFWAWVLARLTGRKCIYYCIDFYSPEIAKNLWDKVFIWSAMKMDKFLVRHCDELWNISDYINVGRLVFGDYFKEKCKVVPLSYPPSYFRFIEHPFKDDIVFVGLDPYGLELLDGIDYIWLGKDKLLPLEVLLDKVCLCGIGFSMWKEKGNNYYGDPGKTKLYSACGLPVIMTDNTPYAEIIKRTQAGLVVNYDKKSVRQAIDVILSNYDFYKGNVKKTWRYINADNLLRNLRLLV